MFPKKKSRTIDIFGPSKVRAIKPLRTAQILLLIIMEHGEEHIFRITMSGRGNQQDPRVNIYRLSLS